MPEKHAEYYVVEYFPDITKNDALAIGIVLLTPNGCWTQFRSDWTAIRAAFPQAATEYMDALGKEIASSVCTEPVDVVIYRWRNALCNNVQMRGPITHDGDTTDAFRELARQILHE